MMTLSAYARLHGVSPQAVDQWKRNGHLVLNGRKVAVEASDERLRGAGLGRFKRRPDLETSLEDGTAATFLADLLAGKLATVADAERVKQNALAGLRALEMQQKAGALCEIETANHIIFECARQFRDALMNWPTRIGPILAADLGVPADRLTQALSEHVNVFLVRLSTPEVAADDAAARMADES